MSSSQLDKLQVIQNKALKVATGCNLKAAMFPIRAETGVHLRLWSQQFYTSDLQHSYPVILSSLTLPNFRPLRPTFHNHRVVRDLQARGDDPNAPPVIVGGVVEEGSYLLARHLLLGWMIVEITQTQASNKVLMAILPHMDSAKQLLPLSELPSPSSAPVIAQGSKPTTTPKAEPTSLSVPHIPTDLAPEI